MFPVKELKHCAILLQQEGIDKTELITALKECNDKLARALPVPKPMAARHTLVAAADVCERASADMSDLDYTTLYYTISSAIDILSAIKLSPVRRSLAARGGEL